MTFNTACTATCVRVSTVQMLASRHIAAKLVETLLLKLAKLAKPVCRF